MQNKKLIYFIVIICLLVINNKSFSQSKTPYSEFGFGNINQTLFSSNFALGGLSSAYRSSKYINPVNPASLTSIKYTVAETGIKVVSNSYGTENSSAISTNFNLSSAVIGFPLNQKSGLAIGLLPYSTKNYSYSRNIILFDDVNATNKFEGNGNVSNLFIGYGYKIKNLSVGAKASYLFGNLSNTSKLIFNSNDFLNVREQDFDLVRGFTYDAGLQYEIEIGDKNILVLSVNGSTGNSINISNYKIINDFEIITSGNEAGDIVDIERHDLGTELFNSIDDKQKRSITLPTTIQAGLSYSKPNSYLIGVEYQQTDWNGLDYNNMNNQLSLQQKIIIGGEWVPNPNAGGYGKFWKTLNYRSGLYFGNAPYKIGTTQLVEYGMNFGFSIPLSKMKFETEKFGSYLNVGFGYGYRGAANLPTDNFYQFNLGIVLNDKWFIQRKFN